MIGVNDGSEKISKEEYDRLMSRLAELEKEYVKKINDILREIDEEKMKRLRGQLDNNH